MNWSELANDHTEEEAVMQISGAGHWFLEGWFGDHAVDFLVDSGSAVAAVSGSFYRHLRAGGAPVGEIQPTNRRLRGANGSQIDIMGCSFCVVSFLGLRTEFPFLVCDLSTDTIIGTDTLGCKNIYSNCWSGRQKTWRTHSETGWPKHSWNVWICFRFRDQL